jgi:hypothetical protein
MLLENHAALFLAGNGLPVENDSYPGNKPSCDR